MKRIISLTLVLLMLATLVLTATSCEFSMESRTGFTQLRDYVMSKDGDKDTLSSSDMSAIEVRFNEEENKNYVHASISGETTKESLYVVLTFTGSTEKAYLDYLVVNKVSGETVSGGVADILLTHYTGDDMVVFRETSNMQINEIAHREYATTLLNRLLIDLDEYMNNKLDLNVRDIGFVVLSDKYMAKTETTESEENLGGMFSSARLVLAGQMVLMGVGMVFLVLAILWIVLLIFKAVFYKDPNKKSAEKPAPAKAEAPKKAAPAPAPVAAAPVAASAPATDDGQLIAVITAAVAAAIESDPALSSQFASGFRVVSFKKTDKSRNR